MWFCCQVHADCRVWLSTEPLQGFPIQLLEISVRVVMEPPVGLRERVFFPRHFPCSSLSRHALRRSLPCTV